MACLLAVAAGRSAGQIEASDDHPTPAWYEQWQPETDASDTRLADRRVTVWSQQTTLAALLADISRQSSVSLSAVPEIREFRVTAYAEARPVSGAMLALARLLDAYWVFPRGVAPEDRHYILCPYQYEDGRREFQPPGMGANRKPGAKSPSRVRREQQLALYQEALQFDAKELLGEYASTNPWLCADLLTPAIPPMLRAVLALPDSDRETLLDAGKLAIPLRRMSPGLPDHLANWAKGRLGRTRLGGAIPVPGPDWEPRFQTEEERWQHAVVWLTWLGDGALQLYLDIPDQTSYSTQLIRDPLVWPERQAREELSLLGYGNPEETAASSAGTSVGRSAPAGRTAPEPADAEEPDDYQADDGLPVEREHPLLATPVRLEVNPEASIPIQTLLEQVANQGGLAIVAQWQDPEYSAVHAPPPRDGPYPLLDILDWVRQRLGGDFWWCFRGNFLVAGFSSYTLTERMRVPDAVMERLRQMTQPGSKIPVEQIASLLGSLNSAQVGALDSALSIWGDLDLTGAWWYGGLDAAQQRQLSESAALAFSALTFAQRDRLLLIARRSHPWLKSEDLAPAVVRRSPRTLSSGKDGFSLILEYHSPDAPKDRDLLLISPLTFTVDDKGRLK